MLVCVCQNKLHFFQGKLEPKTRRLRVSKMEELFNVSTTHILVVLNFILSIIYLVWPDSTFRNLGIPGPKPLPLIGNFDFKGSLHASDLDKIKKYGKVVGISEASVPSILIGGVDFIKEIGVKQFSHFTNRRSFTFKDKMKPFDSGLFMIDDDHWKYVRSLVTPTFSAGKMKKMSPLMVKTAEILVQNMKKYCDQDKPVNMKELYETFIMDTIGATAFGLEIESQNNKNDPFVFHLKKIIEVFQKFSFLNLAFFIFPKLVSPIFTLLNRGLFPKESVNFFNDIVKQAINLREYDDQKRNDFLQLMMNAHKSQIQDLENNTKSDPTLVNSERDQALIDSEEYAKTQASKSIRHKKGLIMEEIFAQSLLFFFAGQETTTALLSFLSYNLATHPEVQEKLVAEVDEITAGNPNVVYETVAKMPYLDMVVCETLRMYPPAIRADRNCKEACTINGVFIPKNMSINISIWAIHYDQTLWPEPEKFIPERFSKEERAKRNPYAWIPFGIGPRNCVGMRFALLETKIALVKVLQNFIFDPCAETEIPLTLGKTFFLSPPNGITLKLKSREPLK